MSYIRLERDADGIVELIFDQPGKSVNTMGHEYDAAMQAAIADLKHQVAEGGVTGIYLRSGKPRQFFAGGDIKQMLEMDLNPDAAERERMFAAMLETKRPLRELEALGVPVAVGINGPALGGGFEIALACHYRIALEGVQVGLPEAQIGLMPGAGGVVRLTSLLGIQAALPLISQGKRLKAEKALELGLLDELADSEETMHARARDWIKANPEATQPWDREGFKFPGGTPKDKHRQDLQGFLFFGPSNVMAQTKGLMPAQKAIFACISDVARVDFDTAQKIESRYFMSLLLDQTARNMMLAFFVQMEALNRGASRPADVPRRQVRTLGILGGGQMGSGIATAAAQKGIDVVLKDTTLANAEKAKDYAEQAYAKNRRVSDEQAAEYLNRIQASDSYADLADCDLVIEAVFEDRAVKAAVTRDTEAVLGKAAVFASNTSALPITELAEASSRPQNFIGMHFFSPADKMPLVEIIRGRETSDETLALAFDLTQQLGKTPIVVQDAPGFFTTRVIGQTISQGAMMVTEGINPVLIESAARDNGSPVGPLAAIDEISQETAYKNGQQAKADAEAQGKAWEENAVSRLMDRMVNEWGRKGKRYGAGYYDYPENGQKRIWPGLREHFAPNGWSEIPYRDIRDRLLYSQSLEAVRILEEGTITSIADGNIGSIMGIGFPPHTGGAFQFINAVGLQAFVDRARELAERYGEVFQPPALLVERARNNELFL